MSFLSIPIIALFALSLSAPVLAVGGAQATTKLKEVLCQYHYGFDKDLAPTEWRSLEFLAQPSGLNGNEVWTARPARLANSPFTEVVVSLIARESQPGFVEITVAPVNPAVEVIDNNFFSGNLDDRGMILSANLAEHSESIPEIRLADAAAEFPNGYLVLGLKCEQELRGFRSVWPRIRRKL